MIKDVVVLWSGQVQGVGFRAEACDIAGRYMVDGWVQNLPDGSVKMLARGEESEVQAFLRALRQSRLGSLADEPLLEWAPPGDENLSGFTIRY